MQGSRQQCAGRADRHARADAIGTARPAGVDEPAIDAVARDQFAQQIAVFGRMTRHEGRAEAGREGRLRLGNTLFRAGDLGGVAGQEVIHGLGRCQLRERRHHAEGIGGQHDDILRVRRGAGRGCVRNEVERIGAACVLGQAGIVEIGHAIVVEDDVFEHRAETFGCGEDFRFGLGRQADRLGVAAALEIEDAGFAPAMLVVADQRARGVGRQRGLAGARQAEEHGRIVLIADIGRAVHRHDGFFRQDEVEIGEDRLLHLAGIGGTADQHDAAGEIARNDGLGAAAMALGMGAEGRQVDDRHVGRVIGQRLAIGTDQQVADEQRMPGEFGNDPGRQTVFGVCAAGKILDVKLHAGGMVEHVLMEALEFHRVHRLVVVPPDGVFGQRIADDELVLGGTAGVLACLDDEGAAIGNPGLAAANGVLVQFRRLEIPVDRGRAQTGFGKIRRGRANARLDRSRIGRCGCAAPPRLVFE